MASNSGSSCGVILGINVKQELIYSNLGISLLLRTSTFYMLEPCWPVMVQPSHIIVFSPNRICSHFPPMLLMSWLGPGPCVPGR